MEETLYADFCDKKNSTDSTSLIYVRAGRQQQDEIFYYSHASVDSEGFFLTEVFTYRLFRIYQFSYFDSRAETIYNHEQL